MIRQTTMQPAREGGGEAPNGSGKTARRAERECVLGS